MVGLSAQNVLGCDQYLVIPGNNIRSEESKTTTKEFVQTPVFCYELQSWGFSVSALPLEDGVGSAEPVQT